MVEGSGLLLVCSGGMPRMVQVGRSVRDARRAIGRVGMLGREASLWLVTTLSTMICR